MTIKRRSRFPKDTAKTQRLSVLVVVECRQQLLALVCIFLNNASNFFNYFPDILVRGQEVLVGAAGVLSAEIRDR